MIPQDCTAVEQLVSQVSQGVFADTRTTLVTKVTQVKQLPALKHQCPVAAPTTPASAQRQKKGPKSITGVHVRECSSEF